LRKRQAIVKQINDAKVECADVEGSPNTVIRQGKYYRSEGLARVFEFSLNGLLNDCRELTAVFSEPSKAEAKTLIEELKWFNQEGLIEGVYSHKSFALETIEKRKEVDSEIKRLEQIYNNYFSSSSSSKNIFTKEKNNEREEE